MKQRSTVVTAGAVAGVVLLALLLYWPGLAGPFVLDDLQNIRDTYNAEPTWKSVTYTVTHNTSGMLSRPIAVLSFVLTGMQYGLAPWGYKFHNLLIHLCCGLVLFRLLYLTLPLLEQKPRSNQTLLIAGAVCCFWLLHPLLVSTVLYAVQRMAQLATLFTLLALLVYVEARQMQTASLRYWLCAWLLFPPCLLLALFSKESGALIPVYVVLFEVFVFRTTLADLKRNRRQSAWLALFVAAPLVLGGLYVLTHFELFTNYSTRTFTLGERLLTQVHVIFFYARLILLPRVRDMGLFHDDYPLTQTLDASTALLLAVLLLVPVLIWFTRRRLPVLAFGLAWFLASHLLESTFVPLELVFEHRNYAAALGLLLPPVYYVLKFVKPRALQGLLAAYLLIFTVQTWGRVQEWSDEGILLTLAVADHPASPRARSSLANYFFLQNRIDEGAEHLQIARSLNPANAGYGLHLLVTYCRVGERRDDVLTEVEAQLRAYPASVYALNGLENLLVALNRKECTVLNSADAQRLITAAMDMPDNRNSTVNYGYLRRFQGIQALQAGLYAQGVIAMREAHANSGYTSILAELLRYQIALGQLDDAADTLAYMEELNAASLGIETYLVEPLREELATASLGITTPEAAR